MYRPKLNCLDIILFSAFAYALSDCIKNWVDYAQSSIPLNIYIIISVTLLFLFRAIHFAAHHMATSGLNNPRADDLNRENN